MEQRQAEAFAWTPPPAPSRPDDATPTAPPRPDEPGSLLSGAPWSFGQRARAPRPSWTFGGQTSGARVAAIIGAVLVGIAPFIPWVHVVLLGDLNLQPLLALAGIDPNVAYLGPVLAIAAALVLVHGQDRSHAQLVGVLGLVVIVAAGYVLMNVISGVREAQGFASVGAGGWAGVIGGALMLLGSRERPRRSG